MRHYLARRLLQVIPTLVGISFLVFLIINASGSSLSYLIGPHMTWEQIEAREKQLGLDRPLLQRYLTWLSETARGNLGYSIRYSGRSVADLIRARLGPTLLLTFTALSLSFLVAVPIGVYSATHQYSRGDYLVTFLTMAAVSVPVFFLGIAAVKLFAFDLGWFPVGGMTDIGREHGSRLGYLLDLAHHLVLPVSVLACAETARFVRFIRSSMLEVLGQDYIRTARAKGLAQRVVIYRHALRNALIPVITILGLSLPCSFPAPSSRK